MDETRKAEIRLRAEAATPPPWHGIENNPIDDYWAAANPEDADFIAYARQDVPDLLTALDAAEQRAKELDLANYDVTQNNRGLWDELTAANRRVAEAEATIDKLYDALIWCSGSGDFAPGGKARKGWLKLAQPLLDNLGEENQKK